MQCLCILPEDERRGEGERSRKGERRGKGERSRKGEKRGEGERSRKGERRGKGERRRKGEKRGKGERSRKGERRGKKERESSGGRKGRCVGRNGERRKGRKKERKTEKEGGEGEREKGEGNMTISLFKTQTEIDNVPFPWQVAPKTRCSWHKVQQCAHCPHTFPEICETIHSSMLIQSYSMYMLTVNSKVHAITTDIWSLYCSA